MTSPLLEAAGLSKSFGAVLATDALSLSVLAGEIHALIGPNGAGKTTLIAQLSGELAPDTGSIRFLGENITALDIQERVRRGLARSFQITSVFPRFTALENVSMAVQAAQRDPLRLLSRPAHDATLLASAREHLDRVGLAERAAVTAAELSHGEHRQLEIAMALALQPKLILLDEPMAGMGRADSQRMASLLRSLRPGVAMLLVEHDMDVVFSLSDRVTVLLSGAVIASGSPADIRANAEVRGAYLGEWRK
jgi:branched-chain amino acid transport system ATP-binding protein